MGFSSELRVGLMTVVGLAILAGMVFLVGDIDLFSPTWPVTFKFRHVDGLLVGSKVTLSGVKCGKVDRIEVKSGVVHVSCRIDTSIQIPTNAKITIDTMGLMGEKYVGIIMPEEGGPVGGFVKPDAAVDGIEPVRMTRIMSEGDEILTKVRTSVDAINKILGDPKFIDSVKNSAFSVEETMASINLTSRNFDNRLDELQGRFERFLDRLDDAGIQMVDILEEARDGVLESVDNIRETTDTIRALAVDNRAVIDRAIKDFSETAASLKKMLRDVEHDGSTAGDLRATIENLKRVTEEIRKIFDDGQFGADLKGTTGRLRSVMEKVDGLFGRGKGLKAGLGYTSRYNTDRKLSSNDLNLDLGFGGRDLTMGVRDIGHGSELDFQLGAGGFAFMPGLKSRVGIIKSKMGVGFDYSLMKGSLTMVDIIDTRHTTIDSTSLYRIRRDVSLLTRVEDALSKDREYNLGLRYNF